MAASATKISLPNLSLMTLFASRETPAGALPLRLAFEEDYRDRRRAYTTLTFPRRSRNRDRTAGATRSFHHLPCYRPLLEAAVAISSWSASPVYRPLLEAAAPYPVLLFLAGIVRNA